MQPKPTGRTVSSGCPSRTRAEPLGLFDGHDPPAYLIVELSHMLNATAWDSFPSRHVPQEQEGIRCAATPPSTANGSSEPQRRSSPSGDRPPPSAMSPKRPRWVRRRCIADSPTRTLWSRRYSADSSDI